MLLTIREVKEQDFPYEHSRLALQFIEDRFCKLERTLKLDPSSNDPRTIRTACQAALREVIQFLPVVGFILRSTDVSGPLELYGPFLRLTHRALGDTSKLIISSEWEFSPFTLMYPELFENEYVLVGLPFSEASNGLIAPLAGHELGHNIWESALYREQFEELAKPLVLEEIQTKRWEEFSKQFDVKSPDQLTDLAGPLYWDISWGWAVSQCEEMFCDLVALQIFGQAYLHAFSYLLAPGLGGTRVERYPTMKDRIRALTYSCTQSKIDVPDNYSDSFDEDKSANASRGHALLLSISDAVAASLVPKIHDAASTFVAAKGLAAHSAKEVERVFQALLKVVPATATTHIANILNAAWRFSISGAKQWEDAYPSLSDETRRADLLNELLLKSFEVFEIEQRQQA
jgi:hypothetical protein